MRNIYGWKHEYAYKGNKGSPVTDSARSRERFASLATRLAVAFGAVALVAVVLVVGLVVFSTATETANLASSERQHTADAAADAAAAAYVRAGGWDGADLTGAVRIAEDAGGRLTTLDAQGRIVAGAGAGRGSGIRPPSGRRASSTPVSVAGRTVGEVVFRVPGSGLSRSEQRLRDRLVTIAIVGGVIAVLLALTASAVLSRRITAPLRRLTTAARALEAGDTDARADADDAPGEIGELAAAFDHLAQTLNDQAEARRALLAEIAHELRTPLAILRGNCEALVDGVERPTPERLSSLHDEVLRLEGLVADLETLADSEATSLRLELAPVDLAEVAGDALDLMRGRAAAAGISLSASLNRAIVLGDRARLVQVVENLLSNALKFTPAGGRVSVSVASAGETVARSRWPTAGAASRRRICPTSLSDTGAGVRPPTSVAEASASSSSMSSFEPTTGPCRPPASLARAATSRCASRPPRTAPRALRSEPFQPKVRPP